MKNDKKSTVLSKSVVGYKNSLKLLSQIIALSRELRSRIVSC